MICVNNVCHAIQQKNRYRWYPCLTSSILDIRLSTFESKNPYLYSYPYLSTSEFELNKNIKTNMFLVISICIWWVTSYSRGTKHLRVSGLKNQFTLDETVYHESIPHFKLESEEWEYNGLLYSSNQTQY